MTTIVSNGHFLVADHRITRFVNGADKKNTLDITNGQVPDELVEDIRMKIELVKPGLVITKAGSYVEAFAIAGNAMAAGYILDIIKLQHGRPIELVDLIELLTVTPSVRNTTVLAISKDAQTTKVEISSSRVVTSYVFAPGKIISAGSGSDAVNCATLNLNLISPVTLGDLVSFAAACDPNTSPSYSVYSRDEKILYTSVIPDYSEFRKSYQRVLANMRKRNRPHYAPIKNCV